MSTTIADVINAGTGSRARQLGFTLGGRQSAADDSVGRIRCGHRGSRVREVHEDRDAVEIHAAEAEAIVRELLARDAGLTGLEISSAGLEEAFLALTHDTTATAAV